MYKRHNTFEGVITVIAYDFIAISVRHGERRIDLVEKKERHQAHGVMLCYYPPSTCTYMYLAR